MNENEYRVPGEIRKASAIESNMPGVSFIRLEFYGAKPLGMAITLEGLTTLLPVIQSELTRLTKEVTVWQ